MERSSRAAQGSADRRRPTGVHGLLLLLGLAGPLRPVGIQAGPEGARRLTQQDAAAEIDLVRAPPSRLHVVERVVDGDTLVVRRGAREETLRLAHVDAEERLAGRPLGSPTAPRTVFGEETALWTERLLASAGPGTGEEEARIGILLPPGGEERDAYGRLLCHVLLPDGTDLNLLLVRRGRSPYYEKYGSSALGHEAFVRAQELAQRERLGIWDPRTNRARTPGAPEVLRPYAALLPWWRARAAAYADFAAAEAADPLRSAAADDAADLRRALEASRGAACTVLGAVREVLEREDGTLALRFHGRRGEDGFRALVARELATDELRARIEASRQELRQNLWLVRGALQRDELGYAIRVREAAQLALAGPEPQLAGAAGPAPGPDRQGSGKAVTSFDEAARGGGEGR